MNMVRMNTKLASPVKPLINVGCLFDIPTGTFITGIHGESILNGGMSRFDAIIGSGNLGKSTLAHYRNIVGCYRMGDNASISVYDTEVNIQESRLQQFINEATHGEGANWIEEGKWSVSDKDSVPGEVWFDEFKAFMESKIESKEILVETPFRDRVNDKGVVNPLKVPMPTFVLLDSITNFQTKDTTKMRDDVTIGDSKANMLYMTQNRNNTRVINETHSYCGASSTYVTMTAHVVEKIQIDPYAPQVKVLPALKNNLKIKAPPDFTFLTMNCWWLAGSSPLISKDRTCEYPIQGEEGVKDDTDLNLVYVTQLRSKSGASNMSLDVIISQRQGVLGSLTEFHYLRKNNYFGLIGGDKNYHCALYPEVKLNRVKVRSALDQDLKLARAINICAELLQCIRYAKIDPRLACQPEVLYEDIKNIGYDWDMILSQTRGWWCPLDQHQDSYFLSVLDLLKMRVGEYHPYWLEDDKKTIKTGNVSKGKK